MSIADSTPCKAVCPVCRDRCFNRDGHLASATCGRKTLPELHCCRKHCWGELADMREMLRANERETRREYREEIEQAYDAATKRLKRAVGLTRQ
jgi:hypothetical protein